MKNKRDKIRKMLLSFCSSVSSANEKNAKRIFVEFQKFYSEIFVTNDYSFASVCSSQRKDSEKEVIQHLKWRSASKIENLRRKSK